MAKSRNKSTTGKKKKVASKSSKAKHTVSSKRKAKTSVARSVTPPPPPVCINLSQVFVVGGLPKSRTILSKDTWNLHPYLNETICKLLAEAPSTSRFYVSLSLEMFTRNGVTVVEHVPVARIMQCDCVPTTLMCMKSVQSKEEEFYSMHEHGLMWKEIHDKISILTSSIPLDNEFSEYSLLYCPLPSQLEQEKPQPVESVEIERQDEQKIIWLVDSETAEEAVVEELPSINEQDKAAAVTLLEETKTAEKELAIQQLENKRRRFSEMVHREGMTMEGLENRRVFKVYPQDSRLEPTQVNFTGISLSNGFAKTKFVDRFIGNAERYF